MLDLRVLLRWQTLAVAVDEYIMLPSDRRSQFASEQRVDSLMNSLL